MSIKEKISHCFFFFFQPHLGPGVKKWVNIHSCLDTIHACRNAHFFSDTGNDSFLPCRGTARSETQRGEQELLCCSKLLFIHGMSTVSPRGDVFPKSQASFNIAVYPLLRNCPLSSGALDWSMTRLPKQCNSKYNCGESVLDFFHRGYKNIFSSLIF